MNNIFISLLLIIISVGTFLTYINPQYQDIKELKAQAADYENKMKNVSSIRSKRNDLATKKAELEKDNSLTRLNKFLPDHINNIDLIVDIDRIAKENNIRLSDIVLSKNDSEVAPGEIKTLSDLKYSSARVSFNFDGSYSSIKNFIADIRRSLRLMDIVSLTINKNGDVDNFNVSMTIRTY